MSLSLLLQSPSKAFVNELFQTSFTCGQASVPESILSKCAQAMEVSTTDAGKLFDAIQALIRQVLFESVSSKEAVVALLPADLDPQLKKLVVSVIASNLKSWREQSSSASLSLPQLKEFDWRIDIKTSADTVARMSVPTALVQMKIQELPGHVNEVAPLRSVTFEVGKDTIETMLDGMGKILEQMDSVSGSA